MKLVYLHPNKVVVPEIRVTSAWDPEEYKSFQDSLKADGQAMPIVCIKDGAAYVLVDGLHRLEEAKLKGWDRIAVAYREGSLSEAMTRNLYMNRLRGKTKASEEIQVVKYLQDKLGMSFADIRQKTGISEDRLDMLLKIGDADPLILQALDREELGVGHAFHLSRLPQKASQLRLLGALRTMIPFPTVTYVKEVVDSSLEIIREREKDSTPKKPSLAIPTVKCSLCEQEWPLPKMVGINVCRTCYGLAADHIAELKANRTRTPTEQEALAERITELRTNREGEP